MGTLFTAESKIGNIVARFPKAGELFKQYRIDFCCGGDRLLGEVAKEQNLNPSEVVEKLNQLYEDSKSLNEANIDWITKPYSVLIDHIVNTHHAYLNEKLPQLSDRVTTILRVHGPSHRELAELHTLFHKLKMEMDQHMIKEEVDAFPLIKDYELDPTEEKLEKALRLVEALESEHSEAGDLLKEIRKLTNDFAIPEDACMTYERTFRMLEDLESDMFQHVHLENNILFPRLANEEDHHDDDHDHGHHH